MRRRVNGLLSLAAALCLWAGAAGVHAGSPAPEEGPGAARDRLKEQSEALQRRVREHEAEAERFGREEEDVLNALETADRTLQGRRRKALLLRAELDGLDLKIGGTREALEDLARRIRATETYMAGRLAALYKTSRLGALTIVATADSMTEVLRRQAALKRILDHDEAVRETLMKYRSELSDLRSRLLEDQEQQAKRMGEYENQIRTIAREKSTREALLSSIRGQKTIQLAAIDRLKDAARELDRELESLAKPGSAGGARLQPASKPFSALKGLLLHPVKGRIVDLYGPYKLPRVNVQAFRSGISIAAEKGEPVRAVHAGRVLYASGFKGYGNVVIIDHGEHYYSVYAHLEEIFLAVDRLVDAGDVIATAGDSGGMGASGLYFELRHHGKPMDPLEWLKK
jgi:septal ring factor EnvC (AmiA/AmiB activator)